MLTPEYHKASQTGIADHSKPGAAAGLAEYNRKRQASMDAAKQNMAAAPASGRAAGEVLGTAIAFLFPFAAFIYWSYWLALMLAEQLNLGSTLQTIPGWYGGLTFVIALTASIAARIFVPAILSWITIATLVVIAYRIFA